MAILIGVRSNGVMTVIADWPHVPKQADVQQEINAVRDEYATFVLCTPTSILSADGNGDGVTKDDPYGFHGDAEALLLSGTCYLCIGAGD
jgi:hypothetical protein